MNRCGLLLALAALVAALPGCLWEDECGPDNCSGCCDVFGLCQEGTLSNECGAGGAACQECSGSCMSGVCMSSGTGGAKCESGDIDLSQAASPGVSIFTLPRVDITEPATFMGDAVYQSPPMGICLPSDSVGMAFFANGALVSSWRSNGTELLNTSSLDELIRWITPDFHLPKSPEVPLKPGRHSFRLGASSKESYEPVLVLRRGTRSAAGQFKLNLIFVVGTGLTEEEANDIGSNATIFENLFERGGLVVANARGGVIENSNYAVVTSGNYGGLAQAAVTPTEDPLFTDAINLYFVREILSEDTAGTLLGQSLGIPGVPGVASRGGVVLSLDAHRRGGVLDTGALWTTVAHEVGHWHGLRHTTERNGRTHDLVGDTPECASANDQDGDGLLRMDECANHGANNLMFWTYDLAAPPSVVSAGQAYALSAALTVEPR